MYVGSLLPRCVYVSTMMGDLFFDTTGYGRNRLNVNMEVLVYYYYTQCLSTALLDIRIHMRFMPVQLLVVSAACCASVRVSS